MKYAFTLDQLVEFLSEHCGMGFDATKVDALRNLLESLAEDGEVEVS